MTVQTALQQGIRILEDGGIAVSRLTAEVLLCHALGRERSFLYAHPEDELTQVACIHYGRYLHERLSGKPTQYITKHQEFFGRDFHVTPDVLIPRPETEHVIEVALKHAAEARRIVDVGCGSGAIAVTLALETMAEVLGTDISAAAIGVAAANTARLGARVQYVCCDLLSAVASQSMDLVVSNPPYVPVGDSLSLQREVREWEPPVALFAGETGLEIYRGLIDDAVRVLRPGGRVAFELGFKTGEGVRAMFSDAWDSIGITPDLAGIPRVIEARLR